jgi:D-alanyl-D-alanine carboxypeptidase (penicillin-binding protein 5/6)
MKKIIIYILAISLMFSKSVSGEEADSQEDNKNSAKAIVLMEASSGTIVKKNNEDEKLSPASITKIMTLILIFDAIHNNKIKLTDKVTTSAHAKSMGGSQVFLEEGETQTVETLIKCIIIASGNDASVAMAEHISGSEEEFVKQMNKRAKKLGMNNTHFKDCCGLTDDEEHYTSARDVAVMSRELITKYPEIFKYSTIWMEPITHVTSKGESQFMLTNTNKLLKTNQYVKGLKTGSTSKAKYCVSVVAEKNGVELIAVVMAANDYKARFSIAESLINYGFSNCKVYKDNTNYKKRINISGGKKEKVLCDDKGFSYVDVKGSNLTGIKKETTMRKEISAPIKKGDVLGKITYTLDNKIIGENYIVALESVKKADFMYTINKMAGLFLQIA